MKKILLIGLCISMMILMSGLVTAITDQEIMDNYIFYDSGDQTYIPGNTSVGHASDNQNL